MTIDDIERLIVTVPDFPKPGIQFKDITPVLANRNAFEALAKILAAEVPRSVDKLVAIESRGFILGAAVAQHCHAGLVLARKPGKLPRPSMRENYELEYGTDGLEIQKDDVRTGDNIMIIDDVLATGGTASAVERLCMSLGAKVTGSLFLMEIEFLKGRDKMNSGVRSLIKV